WVVSEIAGSDSNRVPTFPLTQKEKPPGHRAARLQSHFNKSPKLAHCLRDRPRTPAVERVPVVVRCNRMGARGEIGLGNGSHAPAQRRRCNQGSAILEYNFAG